MAGLFASLFGAPASTARETRAPSYSLPRLHQLYDKLSMFRESDLERPGGGEAVVETVRQITEALIWGEQNDTNFFDFFCEKSILQDFIRVLDHQKAPKTVKVQLLQTLSMLVQNIRRSTSLYYLLSNNQVNKLICMRLDFNDEEILAYYITLLKSLAMRLDGETIKFFFVQHPEPSFPLYTEVVKFFGHRDQMVRATVRTITLQVYPIEFPPMRMFVLRHAAESYFSQLAFHLRDLWLRLDTAASSADGEHMRVVQRENDLQQDLQIFLSDVFELQVAELNEILADRLLNGAMLPLFLAAVSSAGTTPASAMPNAGARGAVGGVSGRGPNGSSRVLTPVVALFLMRQVFETFRCRVLLEPLAAALLHPVVPAALACALPDAPSTPPAWPSSVAPGEEDQMPNALRSHFVKFLRSQDDATFLLAAAVVHSCARNRQALSQSFLETAQILPPSSSGALASTSGSRRKDSKMADKPFLAPLPSEGGACEQLEVLALLLQALQRHASWQPATFRVLARIILDIFLDQSACHHCEIQAMVIQTVESAMRAAGQRLRCVLQEAIASRREADTLLDVLLGEWQLHTAPLINVTEVCCDASQMLARSPGPASVAANDQRSVRSFLTLRRLLASIIKYVPQVPREQSPQGEPLGACFWAGPCQEASPLEVDGENKGSFREGLSFEMGSTDRIVCGVAAPDGQKHTRYLVHHDIWLLLVQPDLKTPGWAVVTTLWPIHLIQSQVDRSDPRTLHIGMQQAAGSSAGAGGDRRGALLTLNFEDVSRCHSADMHLRKNRQEVRKQLMLKALSFVDACLAKPSPQLPLEAIFDGH